MKMIFPFPVKIRALKCQATDCKCQCGGTVEDVEEAIQSCWRKGACGFTRVNTNKLLRREKKTELIVPALLESRPPIRVNYKPDDSVMEVEFPEPLVIYMAPPKQQKKKK